MSFEITDYCDVHDRAEILGLNAPNGLSFLPRHFDTASSIDELVHESAVQTVRILFRENDLQESRIEGEGQRIPCIQENEFAIVLPTLFVGSMILSQNPHLISVALNVISNYCTDFFKGIPGRNKVVLNIVVEDKNCKKTKKIHYEGQADGLKELSEIVGKVFNNEDSN
jgi:hypothetical protein